MSADPTDNEEARRLRRQIERLRAAISDEEQALALARGGRDYPSVTRLEANLTNQRDYLAELLERQARLTLDYMLPEEPIT